MRWAIGRLHEVARSPLHRWLAAIDECLTTGQPIVRRALEMPHAGDRDARRCHRVSSGHGGNARRHLPVLRSDRRDRARGAASVEGNACAARRADCGNRPRVSQRSRDHSWVRQAARSGSHPATVQTVRRRHSAGDGAIGQVVTNFLNFARPTQLSLATYDLGAIIDRACGRSQARRAQLNGDIVVSGDFGQVDADDVLLRQAFMNLLRNAIEACQGAGVTPDVRVDGALDAAQAWLASPCTTMARVFRPTRAKRYSDRSSRRRRLARVSAWPGPEDHRHAQRPRPGDDIACGWRELSSDVAARLTLRRIRHRRICDLSPSHGSRLSSRYTRQLSTTL